MLKVIVLKIFTVSCFLRRCPVYQSIQNSWLCQCFTISVIFIKFLKNLVHPIPYVVSLNRIVCVSFLFRAAQCHRLSVRLVYFKLFVVSRWKTKKTHNKLYLILVFPSIGVKSESFCFFSKVCFISNLLKLKMKYIIPTFMLTIAKVLIFEVWNKLN